MMMTPLRTALAVALGLLAGVTAAAPAAWARSEALVITAGAADQPLFDQVRAALLGRHQFTAATVVATADPGQAARLARAFLSAPGGAGERRLLWLVSTDRGQPGSLCPALGEPAAALGAATVIVAPACAKWLVRLPGPPLHVDSAVAALDADAGDGSATPLVLVNLAADGESAAATAGLLATGPDSLSPLHLLARLACTLRQPPSLDAVPAAAAWQLDLFGAAALARPSAQDFACAAAAPAAPQDQAQALARVPVTSQTLPPPSAVASPAAVAAMPSFRPPLSGRVVASFGSAQKGIDIAVAPGTPVAAAAGGEVVFAGTIGARGEVVAIKHGDGWSSIYAHLGGLQVAAGDRVAAGQRIATSGASGKVSEPLLHFELRLDGKAVDPTALVTGGGA